MLPNYILYTKEGYIMEFTTEELERIVGWYEKLSKEKKVDIEDDELASKIEEGLEQIISS